MKNAPPARAFTLVEMVAAMVIIGVIGAVGAMTLQRAAAANSNVSQRAELFADASTAMDRITRFLQRIPARTATSPADPTIAAATTSSITLDDGSTLSLSGQDLILRDVPAGDSTAVSPVLLTGVTAFTLTPISDTDVSLFTQFGTSTLSTTQAADTQRIAVQFTITRAGQSVTLRSRAFIRSTMSTSIGQ